MNIKYEVLKREFQNKANQYLNVLNENEELKEYIKELQIQLK